MKRMTLTTADPTTEMTPEKAEWLAGLQAMVDFLAEHPEAIRTWDNFQLDLFFYPPDTVGQLAEAAKRLGGRWDKSTGGSYFFLTKSFPGGHAIHLNASRESVCTRVQVGTTSVEVPDPDAPKIVVETPVYEWVCPDSLLAPAE